MPAADEDVSAVFEAWRARQAAPERVRLTPDRVILIRSRLRSHSVEDLLDLIAYAHDAETPEARFWRGENDRSQTYLGLDNLLVASKLSDRIDRARTWAAGDGFDPSGEPAESIVLSPIGALREASRRGGG